jgi:hypothetical protein
MNSLLSFLLRSGGGVLRESAEVFLGQVLVTAATQRLKGFLLFYSVLSVFALATVAFLYVLLYRWLSLFVGDVGAAAIVCGGNLALIAFMLAGRAVIKPKASAVPNSPILEMLKAHTGGAAASSSNFSAGMEIGSQIGKHVRKAAPQIAIAAAVVGLVIGLRPQVLGLFSRREPPRKP